MEYFYDGSYRKSFLKFRPELASNDFVDQVDLNAINSSRQRANMEVESDEAEIKTTGADSCDNYDRAKWNEILTDISQKLAEVFVKKPIDLEP